MVIQKNIDQAATRLKIRKKDRTAFYHLIRDVSITFAAEYANGGALADGDAYEKAAAAYESWLKVR